MDDFQLSFIDIEPEVELDLRGNPITQSYKARVGQIRKNAPYVLKLDDLFENMDIAYDNVNNMTVLYKRHSNALYVHNIEMKHLGRGLQRIMATIQDHYLNAYECYLVRQLCAHKGRQELKTSLEEFLRDYYKFLLYFSLLPFVKDKYDADILTYTLRDELIDANPDDLFDDSDRIISERYMCKFYEMGSNMTTQERQHAQSIVLDVIKQNNKSPEIVRLILMTVYKMINMDDGFMKLVEKFTMVPVLASVTHRATPPS